MKETSSTLFDNPFLDPFASPKGGVMVELGQPLIRLEIPDIRTLIYKTSSSGSLSMINMNQVLTSAGITPRQPILVQDENVGIELNLNILENRTSNVQINSADLPSGQTIGRKIPANAREARDVLHLISSQRAGSSNNAFSINELKKIARNLNIPATGSKDVLVNNIRNYIIDFFDLPRD
jgi:hypothetical protein